MPKTGASNLHSVTFPLSFLFRSTAEQSEAGLIQAEDIPRTTSGQWGRTSPTLSYEEIRSAISHAARMPAPRVKHRKN